MRRGLTLATGLAAGVAGLSCSGEYDTTSSTVEERAIIATCEADLPTLAAAPLDLNYESIAANLGVSVDRLQRGAFGPVVCDESVDLVFITTGDAIVAVNGMDSPCFAIGTAL